MKRYSTGIVILSTAGECEFHVILARGNTYSAMVNGFDAITPASRKRLQRATKTWRRAITRDGRLAMFNPVYDERGE